MRKVHIVIPSYNHWDLTHSMLFSLYKKEKDAISSILIVDDASTDEEVKTGLRWWAERGITSSPELFVLLPSPENKGFLRTANSGIKWLSSAPDDDIVILLSNDVEIYGKFIHQIVDIFNSNDSAVVGGILYSHDTGWNKFGERIFPYLEGWLLATTVLNWRKLNYFDEIYAPCDYEDVDLSTKALSLGMELIPLNNPSLRHLGGKTLGYSENRINNTKKNQKLFGEKWVKDL